MGIPENCYSELVRKITMEGEEFTNNPATCFDEVQKCVCVALEVSLFDSYINKPTNNICIHICTRFSECIYDYLPPSSGINRIGFYIKLFVCYYIKIGLQAHELDSNSNISITGILTTRPPSLQRVTVLFYFYVTVLSVVATFMRKDPHESRYHIKNLFFNCS